jgi:predicted ester cyclase
LPWLWGREVKPLGILLLALGTLGTTPAAAYAVSPSRYSSSVFGWPGLLFGVPWVGIGLPEAVGWVLLGSAILRSGRELQTRELEEQNLRKASRLYEEGLGAGDLSVIDEILAEDFLGRLHDRCGPEGFKHAVSDLRETFPDLEVSVEEQTAEGQTVTTHLSLRGTDRGGVLWYPPTGRHATFAATYEDRFSGGRLVEHRGEVDMRGLLEQLGLPCG